MDDTPQFPEADDPQEDRSIQPAEGAAPPSLPLAPPEPRVILQLPQKKPILTYSIIAVTVLVYVLQIGSQSIFGYDLPALLGMKVNSAILAGEIWRLITPILLHGSMLHIGFNMYALYLFGPQLETHFGRWQFLLLYLVSGFGGVVASFALSSSPSLGASTSIFGLLAAHGVFAYQNKEIFGARARIALRNVIQIAGINFLIGLSPGIDNWGHFGGFLGGFIIAWVGGPLYEVSTGSEIVEIKNQREDFQFIMAIWGTLFLFGGVVVAIAFFR